MTNIGFHILFVLNFVLLSCKGQVFPPSNQSMIVVLPGSTPKLKWTFQGDASRATLFWYFTKRGTSNEQDVATKVRTQPAVIYNSSLPRVAIEDTATLVLNKVDESYNGKYRINVAVAGGGGNAEVDLFIAAQPNPGIINCSDPTTVNENTDLACSCRDVAGNPPASLTWFDKDDVRIGNTSYGENILILTNVTKKDSGRYTCKAQSYTLKAETSFELIVHFKPDKTDIAFTRNPAFVDQQLTVTCDSNGLPKPNYTIIFNENVVSNRSTHVIKSVKMTNAGTYKCIAKNKLGSHSDSKNLTVEQGPTTSPNLTPRSSSSTPSGKSDKGSVPVPPDDDDDDGPNIGLIVGIVIGVLVLILIIGFVVYCYKSKEKERRNRGNIDPAAGNHYELENEDAGAGDNAYDSVGPVGTSSGKSKPVEKKNTLPPVYAAVDKNNRQGNTLYASLDTDAMKPKRESKKEPERTPQTEYASIDFAKRADDNVPKADLV